MQKHSRTAKTWGWHLVNQIVHQDQNCEGSCQELSLNHEKNTGTLCRNCGMPHITSFGISFVGAPPASMLILMPADSASPPKRVRTFQNSLRKKGNFPQFIKFIKISCEIFCSHLQVAFRCSKLLRQGFLLRHFRVRGILWDLGAFLEKKRHPFLVIQVIGSM